MSQSTSTGRPRGAQCHKNGPIQWMQPPQETLKGVQHKGKETVLDIMERETEAYMSTFMSRWMCLDSYWRPGKGKPPEYHKSDETQQML